MEVLVPA